MRTVLWLPILVFAFFTPTISRAQSSLVFGLPNFDEEGYEVIATSDGGYMVGGQFTDSSGAAQFYVVKVNAKGSVAWDTVYELGYDRAFLWSIQPDGFGGALLAGYTGVQNSGTESALVLDIDSVGHILKKYDLNYARADHAHWFARRKTGGYFWAGHTDSESDSSGVMILMRLDDNLDSVWQKTYSYRPNSYEHAHCGTLTSDGGCVLAGHTFDGTHENTWAVRVDSNGNVIWKKAYVSSSTTDDSPYGVITTREGNFAIFGGIDGAGFSKMRLLVIDSNGKVLVDKGYGNGSAYAFDGFQTSDGGFVVVGGEQPNSTTTAALAVRTNAKGVSLWAKDFDGVGNAYGYSGFEHNNQYVLIGTTSKPNESMGDFWAIYVDTNGNQVAYDTARTVIHAKLIVAFDSSTLEYVPMQYLLNKGTLQNPNNDSVYFYLREDYSKSLGASTHVGPEIASIPIKMDSAGPLARRSHQPIGIAANETLPVQIIMSLYGLQSDTVTVCYSIEPVEEGDLNSEACYTLYPQYTPKNSVAPMLTTQTFAIWPNPSDKFIALTGASQTLPYRIYNAAGGLMLSGSANERIDVSSLPTGTYEIVVGARGYPFSVVR